jgi:phenylacetate-CoA ligase
MYGVLKDRRERTAVFRHALEEVRHTERWSRNRLEELQADRLRLLVAHAVTHVPYYERMFAEYGLNPGQIQTPDDLRTLPTLTKAAVRAQGKEMIARGFHARRLRTESTSGTTGAPLTVWMNDEAYLHTKAEQWLQHEWAGYTHREWIGILAGYKVVPLRRARAPFWVTNAAGRQIHFSSYHLRRDLIGAYVEKLRRSRVQFLLGYPSAVGLLARFMVERGEHLPIRAAFLSSEPLYEWQSSAISEAFGCTIFNYYGQAERVLSGFSCGKSLNLHVSMESSLLELVPMPGRDDRQRLIATSLLNYAMPLLRYELHDVTSAVDEPCPCGRAHARIRPVETKDEDLVVTPSGRFLSASLFTFPLKKAVGVVQSQVVQHTQESFEVRVVVNDAFSAAERERLRQGFRACVGEEMNVSVLEVPEIPLTRTGKFRFVVSSVAKAVLGLCIVAALLGTPVRCSWSMQGAGARGQRLSWVVVQRSALLPA